MAIGAISMLALSIVFVFASRMPITFDPLTRKLLNTVLTLQPVKHVSRAECPFPATTDACTGA